MEVDFFEPAIKKTNHLLVAGQTPEALEGVLEIYLGVIDIIALIVGKISVIPLESLDDIHLNAFNCSGWLVPHQEAAFSKRIAKPSQSCQ
jgi:hypothetical protein